MLALIPMLLPLLASIIGKILPDPAAAQAATLEMQKALLDHQGELDKAVSEAAKAQAEVNLEEAKSPSAFRGNWRPMVGWCCAVGFGYIAILQPVLAWLCGMAGVISPPVPDSSMLMTTLLGLLGMGSMRTVERVTGAEPPARSRPILKRAK